MLPSWLAQNPDAIQTGSLALDQLLLVLLGTSMVLAFLIGFLLDNTIPGTTTESVSSKGHLIRGGAKRPAPQFFKLFLTVFGDLRAYRFTHKCP